MRIPIEIRKVNNSICESFCSVCCCRSTIDSPHFFPFSFSFSLSCFSVILLSMFELFCLPCHVHSHVLTLTFMLFSFISDERRWRREHSRVRLFHRLRVKRHGNSILSTQCTQHINFVEREKKKHKRTWHRRGGGHVTVKVFYIFWLALATEVVGKEMEYDGGTRRTNQQKKSGRDEYLSGHFWRWLTAEWPHRQKT